MISNTLIRELQVNPGWTREFIDKLTPYYLATLTHISRGRVTPVFQIVDEFWHAHILCTRDYADFCAMQFGRFIHHERTNAIVFDKGADDFFSDYGLSYTTLASVCARHNIDCNTTTVACGSDEPKEPHRRKTSLPAVASCGEPRQDPPAILALASCGQPHTPPGISAETFAPPPGT
jgi:hypothetical protein